MPESFLRHFLKGESMRDYQYILFDLDGTLTDPAEGITNSVAFALKKFGIEVRDSTTLYKFIGPPLVDSFMEFYGFDKQKAETAVKYYREYFSTKGIYENKVYDGIPEMLKKITESGKKAVLATSKPEKFAIEILKHFNLDKYFYYTAGATMNETRNKKQDVIKYALDKCKITDKSAVIMVGDRKFDIEGAHINGIKAIGVLYGYGDKTEMTDAKADFTAKSVKELEKILVE